MLVGTQTVYNFTEAFSYMETRGGFAVAVYGIEIEKNFQKLAFYM